MQVDLIPRSACNYSLLDWPAAQHACAPRYDPLLPGTQQRLPVFELPPGSHLAAAEAAADVAFELLRASGALQSPEQLALGPWDI